MAVQQAYPHQPLPTINGFKYQQERQWHYIFSYDLPHLLYFHDPGNLLSAQDAQYAAGTT